MVEWKKLPVGLENFQEIQKSGFYYVDKTKLIEQLLENWSKVNLFTRPRRFGKTLNMSMLKSFFEIGTDRTLFDGLYISRNQKLCEEYMGKYPVIFLSLKGIDGLSFEAAKYRLTELIGVEAERFAFLADSEKLTENERSKYRAIIHLVNGKYSMDEDMLVSSLQTLSQLLCRHYGQKAMILIDEYDVPLDKAFQHGYYKEMVSLIRGLFGQALKTNQEIREVFVQQIREWFNQIVANNRASIDKINQGFLEGKAETIQRELTMFLGETIRVFDTKARNEEKEIFYHDILLGILKNYSGWVVKSNRESGDGFADILLKPKNPDAGIIVELKDVRSLHDLDQACERALEQIKDRRYDTELREDGRNDILAYGIAFCRKRCKVVVEKL